MEPARSGCPINAAVEAFGDSWSLLVLRDVMFGNRRYFRELLAAGGPELWREVMAELRTIHLGEPAPERDGPSVTKRLAKAHAATL